MCQECDRTFDAPMPKNAEADFFAACDELAARLPPDSPEQAELMREILGQRLVNVGTLARRLAARGE